MSVFDFFRLSKEWIPLFFTHETLLDSSMNLEPFYDTEDVKVVFYDFDDLFVDQFLLSDSLERILQQLNQEGFYPFMDEKITYKKWTKQGVFFLNNDLIRNKELCNLVIDHLKIKKVVWIYKENQSFDDENSFYMWMPLLFKKVNERLVLLGKDPISW